MVSGRSWLAGVSVAVLAGAGAGAQTIELPQITVNPASPIQRPAAPVAPAGGGFVIPPGTFAPLTIVTGSEIDRDAARTLGDLLATRPGISTSGFAPGAASRPVIRGLDNYRVRIQENGIGSHDVSEIGEDHGVPIDPLAARQVEVVRGPATLRWGSQAIGGVVSVTNNRIPDRLPNGGFAAEVKGGLGSADRSGEGSAIIDAGGGNFAIHADAFAREAGDYRIPSYPYLFPPDPAPAVGKRQPNSAIRADGQSVGGSYIFGNGFVGVAIQRFASLYRVPGIESTDELSRIDMRQTKITSKGEVRPEGSAIEAIRFWLGGTDYKHDELGVEAGVDSVHQTFTNKEYEGRAEVQFAPFEMRWASVRSAAGVQAGRQRLTAASEDGGLFDPNRTTSVAGFLFTEFDFRQGTRAQAAGRIEHVGVRGSVPDLFVDPNTIIARNLDFTPGSASAGLLQDLPMGVVASITGQYVERAPRGPELLSRGAHHATETFDIGNPNLGIESARTIEAGLKRAQGRVRFEANVYRTRYKGFIYRRLTGLTCGDTFADCESQGAPPGGDLLEAIYSQRDANFTGAEAAAQLDVTPLGGGMLGIDGQYDIVRARFSDGTFVPRVPPQRFGGGVWWRHAQWFARVGMLHAAAQRRTGDNETPTGSFNLLKAELSHTSPLRTAGGRGSLTVGVTGDNLLDEDVRNHVSFRKDQVLQPGRSVRAFAKITY